MTRRAAALLLLLLAGCAGGPSTPDAVPGLVIDSRVIGRGDYVEVFADHRSLDHRVEEIALVAPDGTVYRADEMRRDTIETDGSPGGALGIGGGGLGSGGASVGAGISLGFPLSTRTYYRTSGVVDVPDDAGYAESAEGWTVRVVVEHRSGQTVTFDRPAPRA